ncbi:hypothetical protein BRD02_06265 [Halobacteriales archaeon QS_8_69_73]|nr:MAG: hypothetical protein BRD02_06265 [Halobacteriales archaeon QS_8_69_73]
MERTRRRFLALGAAAGVAVAGCNGTGDGSDGDSTPTTSTATGTETTTGTETETPADTVGTVVVDSVTVQPGLVGVFVDFYLVLRRPETQWVVAEVAAADGPPPESFAVTTPDDAFEMRAEIEYSDAGLAAFGDAYAPTEPGWLAAEVPKPLEAEEAALTWDGGQYPVDGALLDRLRRPRTEFEVSFEAAPVDAVDGAARSIVTIENVGDVAGTFVAGINMTFPTNRPERRITRRVGAGETAVVGAAHRWNPGSVRGGSGRDYDQIDLLLRWRGDNISRSVDVREGS